MPLNTEHLAKCIVTLEASLIALRRTAAGTTEYEVFRFAVIKGFELVLETSGKLLRRALKSFGGTPREIDALQYKDVFRQACKHGLLNESQVESWFRFRENRNQTAHDYGVEFAEKTLAMLPEFIAEARKLEKSLFGVSEKGA